VTDRQTDRATEKCVGIGGIMMTMMMILSETLALYKSFTYLLAYLCV